MTEIDRIRAALLRIANNAWHDDDAREACKRTAPLTRSAREAIIVLVALGWEVDGARAAVCEVAHGSAENCPRCPALEGTQLAPLVQAEEPTP